MRLRLPPAAPRAAVVLAALAAALTAAGIAAAAHWRAADAPVNTVPPSISGTAREGSTLTARPGEWRNAGRTSYQWHLCDGAGDHCAPIAGADAQTFTIGSAQVGGRIRVLVTASGSPGPVSVFSSPTDTVQPLAPGPVNLEVPSVSGTPRAGEKLTATTGRWNPAGTVSYRYEWLRCDAAGGNCVAASAPVETDVATLAPEDVGHTFRVRVLATDRNGTRAADSNPTAVIAAGSVGAPQSAGAPTISGTPQVGQRLTTTHGSWTGTQPMSFAVEWQRCRNGTCSQIPNAQSDSYVVTNDDVGYDLRTNVTASSAAGRQNAYSALTTTVAAAQPAQQTQQPAAPVAGAQRLARGVVSVPVSSVALPARLVISKVSFSPPRMPPGQPVTLGVRVTDTRGYVVRDALVYAVGVPFGRMNQPAEMRTGTDGTVSIQIVPTSRMARRLGSSLVIFVRARKDGDDVLAGVSTRRLVRVVVGR